MHISHTSETCNICLSLSALFHYIFSKLIHVTNAESLFFKSKSYSTILHFLFQNHLQSCSIQNTMVCVCMSVAQSCPTFCNPMDCSPPDSSVHRFLQARILEWTYPSPGDLPDPRIEPRSPALQVDYLLAEPPGKPKYYGIGM